MPYEGFVVVEFKLETSSTDRTIMVPMLVTHETLDYPIVGYNVIEELVKKDEVPDQIVMEWAASFPDVNCEKIQSLVSLIQAPSPEHLCFVKTIKQDVVVPRKTTVSIKCRANTGPVEKRIPVLFEPSSEQSWQSGLQITEELLTISHGSSCRVQINVSNTSNHDITLKKRTVLGTLQLVKSVTTQLNKLYNDFVLRFGFPSRIHHDQGGEFENNLFKHLEELCGVQHSRTTPYHPREMGRPNDSTRPCLPCSEPCQKKISRIGQTV